MKHHTVRLVQRLDEASDIGAHDALERPLLRRDDIDGDTARPQRCRDFEADEAGADDDGMPGGSCALDNRAAVGERAQIQDVAAVGARDR